MAARRTPALFPHHTRRNHLKRTLSLAGATASIGFLAASAVINYTFGYRLGRTGHEQHILGAVAVLAVAMNGLAPFYIQWAGNLAQRAAALLIWSLCVAYTIASAVGFAAENRAAVTGTQAAQHENLQTVQEMLDDELAKRRKNSRRITELRERIIAMRDNGAGVAPDNQAEAISTATGFDSRTVRTALAVLFAVLVEVGAALGLFASVAHLSRRPEDDPSAPVYKEGEALPLPAKTRPRPTPSAPRASSRGSRRPS